MVFSCSENINYDKLIQIDDLMYNSGKKTIYTGNFHQNNKNGKTIIEGFYDKGKPNGIWNFYNKNGKKVGIVDYDKYDKEFILTSNNYKDFLLGEWKGIYESVGSDTFYVSTENTLSLSTYFENKYILKRKGPLFGVELELDSLYDWVKYDIEFKEDGGYKFYNRDFLNVEFKEWREKEGIENNNFDGFICECEIIDYFTIIEHCKTQDINFSYKLIRQ